MKKLGFLIIVVLLLASCEKVEITPVFDDAVSSIVVDKNNTKWIGTDKGLYAASGESVSSDDIVLTAGIISLMYEENNNSLWVGTTTGLHQLTIGNASINNTNNISSTFLSDSIIRCIYQQTETRRWFGADTGMTMNENDFWKNDSFRVNIKNRIFSMPAENMTISSIASRDGDFFIATQGGSIYRAIEFNDDLDAFSGATQWVAPYNGQNTTNNMNVVFVDSKKQLWMGGEQGVQTHTGDDPKTGFTYFNTELPDSTIHVITESPNGKIWIGTEKGIAIQEGTTWKTLTNGLPDMHITAIAFDKNDGSAWVGTKKGISIIK